MWGITKTQYNRALKKGEEVRPIVDVLVEKYKVVSDWNRAEKIKNYFELSNDASDDLLFPPELVKKLQDKEVQSIFEIPEGMRGIGWFTITEVIMKTTKNGKPFMRLKCVDNNSKSGWLRVWGQIGDDIAYSTWMADVKNDAGWGMSTTTAKMKKISAFD